MQSASHACLLPAVLFWKGIALVLKEFSESQLQEIPKEYQLSSRRSVAIVVCFQNRRHDTGR
jgi:hypothetical protein